MSKAVDELVERIIATDTAAPEKKRDFGSSLITLLTRDLRAGVLKLIDPREVRECHARYPGVCRQCGMAIEVGECIAWYVFRDGEFGPMHRRCV